MAGKIPFGQFKKQAAKAGQQSTLEAPADHSEQTSGAPTGTNGVSSPSPLHTLVDNADAAVPLAARFDSRVAALAAEAREPQTPEEYVHRITRLWSEAQDKFLQIGRFLNRARQVYPHGTYEAMIERNLPFAANTARMLRMVSERYDRIPHDRLPNNYSVLYQVTTLSEAELDEAEKRKLIHPAVTRSQIIAFKAELRQSRIERQTFLVRRRDDILRQRQELDKELQRIEDELGVTLIEGTALEVPRE